MNMKFINNSGIADWLNRYSSCVHSDGIDAYVADCIHVRLNQFSPTAYAKSSSLRFTVAIPYESALDLFGPNFIGLLANDGKDYSYIVEDIQKFDIENKDTKRLSEYKNTVRFNRYYAFVNCPVVIRLYALDILYAKGGLFAMKPEVKLTCEIVNKDKVVEEEDK